VKDLRAAALTVALTVGVSGCFSTPRQSAPSPARVTPSVVPAPTAGGQPIATVPDAIPRFEPRSLYGNPPFYDVFGKRYFVMASSVGYVERGVASWYGPGFHKVRTSMGEIYDMYGMTAAHKSLPLPAYVRVTNLENGRSCVVRVNDRGPFVGNRIIDLSYTAAAKLDMLRNGTAMVEVRVLQPIDPAGNTNVTTAALVPQTVSLDAAPAAPPSPPAAAAPAPLIALAPVTSEPVRSLYVQAGAFADPANAERLADKLRGGGYGRVFVRDDMIAGRKFYRVRIGPVPDVPEFDRVVAALEQAGVRDAHLALD
jgi:rare lipoprotein A